MRIIRNQRLLQKYINEHHIEQFFPEKYFDFLLLAEYKRAETICLQGDRLDNLYFLVDGKIKIVRTLVNGKENVLDIREYPCILGEIEFMTDQPFVSSVVAMKKSYVIQFPVSAHREQLMQDASFLYHVGHWIAKQLYQLDINSPVNVVYPVKERLAMHILSTQTNGSFSLDFGSLADSFGTSYRHLLRVISQFIEDGLIEKGKSTYQILDFNGLRNYATERESQ